MNYRCGQCTQCLGGFPCTRKASSSQAACPAHAEASGSQAGAEGTQPPAASGTPNQENFLYSMLRAKFVALLRQLPMSGLPVKIRAEIGRLCLIVDCKPLPRKEGLELLNSLVTPYDALAYLIGADLDSCLWQEIERLFQADPNLQFDSLEQALKIVFGCYALVPAQGSDSSTTGTSLPAPADETLGPQAEARAQDNSVSGEHMAFSDRRIRQVLEAENETDEAPDSSSNPDSNNHNRHLSACPFLEHLARQIIAGHMPSWPTSFLFPDESTGSNNPCPHLRSAIAQIPAESVASLIRQANAGLMRGDLPLSASAPAPLHQSASGSWQDAPPPGNIDVRFSSGMVRRVALPSRSQNAGSSSESSTAGSNRAPPN